MEVGASCQVTAIDYDIVEPHNPPNQAFTAQHIGMLKVHAARELYPIWSNGNPLKIIKRKANRFRNFSGVVILCLDNMRDKKKICHNLLWNNERVLLVIDTRMDAQTCRIQTFDPNFKPHQHFWDKNWYPDEDAVNIGGCDGHYSIITAATITASIAVQQMINWYHADLEVTRLWNDIAINLQTWQTWRRRWPTSIDGQMEVG